jgi:hypothetical protein
VENINLLAIETYRKICNVILLQHLHRARRKMEPVSAVSISGGRVGQSEAIAGAAHQSRGPESDSKMLISSGCPPVAFPNWNQCQHYAPYVIGGGFGTSSSVLKAC